MRKRKITRREAIKATAVGMGAFASASILSGKADARGRIRPVEVTLTLDSGAFLNSMDRKHVVACEVGYFESDPATPDIRVYADGEEVNQSSLLKLGRRNGRIEVLHTRSDGGIHQGLKLTKTFRKHLLRRGDLYEEIPEWNRSAYDCIINFNSGRFAASVVKPGLFRQHLVDGGGPTGNSQTIRPIARDVVVSFELAQGEVLRLTRDDGTDLWSTAEIEAGAKRIEIQITADETTAEKFYRWGLKHKGKGYWLMSDPPPMNGPGPG